MQCSIILLGKERFTLGEFSTTASTLNTFIRSLVIKTAKDKYFRNLSKTF